MIIDRIRRFIYKNWSWLLALLFGIPVYVERYGIRSFWGMVIALNIIFWPIASAYWLKSILTQRPINTKHILLFVVSIGIPISLSIVFLSYKPISIYIIVFFTYLIIRLVAHCLK